MKESKALSIEKVAGDDIFWSKKRKRERESERAIAY